MAFALATKSNLPQARSLLGSMTKLQRQAAVSALNRTAQQVKTAANRKIREQYPGFKAGVVRESLKVNRSQFSKLEVSVQSEGKRTQLIDVSARQTRAGVSIRIGKRREVIRGAFIARMRSGHVGVFSRRTKKRLHIDERYTIAIAEAFGARPVVATMRFKADEVFIPRFQHELARLAKAQASAVVRDG